MKMRKLLLLSAAMLLSLGAYAQDGEGTPVVYHRFPEVQFTYTSGGTTRELTMPAWDIQFGGTGQGFVRVQRIAKTGDAKYTARIVTRQPLYDNGGSAEYRLTSKDAEIEYKGQKYALKDFTYDKIIPDGYESLLAYQQAHGGSDQEHWGTLSVDILKSFPVVHNVAIDGTSYNITGNYTIPKQIINASLGEHNIIEIGPFAYRNPDWGNANIAWFKPSSITIPKEITKIYRDGLSANITSSSSIIKKITFEAGSTITEIPVEAFMGCVDLEEINIPASVTSIGYGALGGCKSLKKIVFEGANPPSLGISDHGDSYFTYFDFVTSSGSTRNIGQTDAHVAADHAKCIMEVPLGSALSYTQKDDLYKKFPMMSKFTMEYNLRTYCSDLEFTFKQYNTSNKTWSDGSLQVYYVEDGAITTGKVVMTEITETKKIPSTDFGVLLRGTQGETYDIFYPNNLISTFSPVNGNVLKGVIEPTDINPTTSQSNYYVLRPDGKFHLLKQSGTLGANKAYLWDEDGGNEHTGTGAMSVTLPGDETGIEIMLVEDEADDAVYTLQGTKVSQPHKGLVIKNGKKFIVK